MPLWQISLGCSTCEMLVCSAIKGRGPCPCCRLYQIYLDIDSPVCRYKAATLAAFLPPYLLPAFITTRARKPAPLAASRAAAAARGAAGAAPDGDGTDGAARTAKKAAKDAGEKAGACRA